MSNADVGYPTPHSNYPAGGWDQQRYAPARAPSPAVPGWMVAGAAVAAVGVLAWYYLGPDLRRYLKIRSM